MNKIALEDLIERPLSGEWGNEGSGIKVIRSTNFTNEGILDLSNVVERSIPVDKVEKKKLIPGDIIIEKSGGSPNQPVGRVVYFDQTEDFLFSNFTSVLRPKNDLIIPKYLHYYLFAAHKMGITNLFQNKTTGIINLQLKRYLESLEIPLPDLKTQQKIADALDKADAIGRRNKEILQKYDDLAQSIFLEMFGDPVKNEKGWKKISLSTLGKITSGSTPSRNNYSYYEGNIPWVKTGEVKGEVIYKTSEHISEEAFKISSCRLNPKGSIVVAMYGQGITRGRVGILGIEAATNQACAIIPPSGQMNKEFLFNLLKFCYNDLRELGRGGNQPNLNVGMIKNYLVINPDIKLQNKYAVAIDEVNKQKEQINNELNKNYHLFQSFLQKAFKGDLFKVTSTELVQ